MIKTIKKTRPTIKIQAPIKLTNIIEIIKELNDIESNTIVKVIRKKNKIVTAGVLVGLIKGTNTPQTLYYANEAKKLQESIEDATDIMGYSSSLIPYKLIKELKYELRKLKS